MVVPPFELLREDTTEGYVREVLTNTPRGYSLR